MTLLTELKNWYLWVTTTTETSQYTAIGIIVHELFLRFVNDNVSYSVILPMFNPDVHCKHCISDDYYYDVEKGLISILKRYQYSLDDTDKITPDFMGLMHESLLSHVDSTNQNARKDTGSYYTPTEITDYMVTLTLDEFQKRGGDLLNCKILDPAVGCGEFPIRVFKEIINRTNPDYQTKLQILTNLYGFDIQPLAVQITQMRLLLMLVSDKPTTLPDLTANFICTDALLKNKLTPQFDVVIGNPPYLQLQTNGGFLAKKYAPFRYQTLVGGGDIYMLFYERGWQLLKPQGLLCYITSNKWLRVKCGYKLRRFIRTHTNPLKLIDFPNSQLFKAASINTNILFFAKEPNQNKPFAAVVKYADDLKTDMPVTLPVQSDAQWSFVSPVEQSIKNKLMTLGSPLKTWNVKIHQGIKTGYDAAFYIDDVQRQKMLTDDPKSSEIIKPLLRGRDIDQNGYTFKDMWVIATLPSLNIDIEQYPAVKAHLLKFYDKLCNRSKSSGTYQWYETQNPTAFWKDFTKTKIVFPLLTQGAHFHIDDNGMYINSSCGMIVTLYPHYLCALLSSPLCEFAIKRFFTHCTLGNAYFNNHNSVLNLPVFYPTTEQRLQIETLYKNKDPMLNQEIYKMHNLTEEEIMLVEHQRSADIPH